jgi:hypothetical protein
MAAVRATTEASHFRVGSRLIDKYQLAWIEMGSPEPPRDALLGHIRPILLSGMQDFF